MDAEMNKANVKNCHQLLAAGTFISLFRQPLNKRVRFFLFFQNYFSVDQQKVDVFRTREIRWFLLEWVTF